MMIFGTLSGIYIIPTIYSDYRKLQQATVNDQDEKVVIPSDRDESVMKHSTVKAEEFEHKAVQDILSKADALHRNATVCY